MFYIPLYPSKRTGMFTAVECSRRDGRLFNVQGAILTAPDGWEPTTFETREEAQVEADKHTADLQAENAKRSVGKLHVRVEGLGKGGRRAEFRADTREEALSRADETVRGMRARGYKGGVQLVIDGSLEV